MGYPIPIDEPARLEALHRYEVLDTDAEASFDDLVKLASQICHTPMSLISLVDADRQWFKAKVGLDASETARELSFCAHALMEPEKVLVVNDATADRRFAGNPANFVPPSKWHFSKTPPPRSGKSWWPNCRRRLRM